MADCGLCSRASSAGSPWPLRRCRHRPHNSPRRRVSADSGPPINRRSRSRRHSRIPAHRCSASPGRTSDRIRRLGQSDRAAAHRATSSPRIPHAWRTSSFAWSSSRACRSPASAGRLPLRQVPPIRAARHRDSRCPHCRKASSGALSTDVRGVRQVRTRAGAAAPSAAVQIKAICVSPVPSPAARPG